MQKTIFLTTTAILLILAVSCGQKSSSVKSNNNQESANSGADEKRETIYVQELTSNEIPTEIAYVGDIVGAYKYVDNTGENIVITTETEVMSSAEDEYGSASYYKNIYAQRFLKTTLDWEEVWRLYDFTDECTNYPVAAFVKGSLSITDLNSDGTAEIWMMYVKSCGGDINPDAMFLRMYNNEEVYTLTGEAKLKLADGASEQVVGGEYKLDDNFSDKNTPAVFVDFAKELWKKHIYGN